MGRKRFDVEMAEAWQECCLWNDTHPVGTKVIYRPILGSDEGMVETVTRSAAWTLASGEAVVMVAGRSGGVALEAVTALERKEVPA